MSGVGEVLAIVSCVAGLIQALDAGQRIVKQIKERRQNHRNSNGALPPSDELERKLDRRKKEIEDSVAEGRQQFGDEFEADGECSPLRRALSQQASITVADYSVTDKVKLAIMSITIQIQNALLEGLAEARGDDGIIDFEECISLTDKGSNQALLVLRTLYQTKLDEALAQKKALKRRSTSVSIPDPTPQLTTSAIPEDQPIALAETVANTGKPRAKDPVTTPPSASERKRSMFSFSRSPKPDRDTTSSPNAKVNTNMPSTRHQGPPERRSTTRSLALPEDYANRNITRPSISSDNSSTAPSTEISSVQWAVEMSRASTLATMESKVSSAPMLSKYSGSCKYAFAAREKGVFSGVMRANLSAYGVYGGESWVYKCKSTKCRFQADATRGKTIELNNKIYRLHGIQYRSSFLIKSHIQYGDLSPEWPFICLFCLWAGRKSDVYYGSQSLMEHVSEHSERTIGNDELPCGGPLTFSNMDVQAAAVSDFDINLPLPDVDDPKTAGIMHGPAELVKEIEKRLGGLPPTDDDKVPAQRVLSKAEEQEIQKDPYANPWA
jgi:hypothetical protein